MLTHYFVINITVPPITDYTKHGMKGPPPPDHPCIRGPAMFIYRATHTLTELVKRSSSFLLLRADVQRTEFSSIANRSYITTAAVI